MPPKRKTTKKKTSKKPQVKKKPTAKKPSSKKPAAKSAPFITALAKLLRSRKLQVPDGLLEAPAEAYANQPADVVDRMADLDDDTLRERAEKIASFAKRQAERAREMWDSSPLIAEVRRRGIRVPTVPKRLVGAAISVKRPLAVWSDDELLDAAKDWSKRGAKP
jgi:hypothetical protein